MKLLITTCKGAVKLFFSKELVSQGSVFDNSDEHTTTFIISPGLTFNADDLPEDTFSLQPHRGIQGSEFSWKFADDEDLKKTIAGLINDRDLKKTALALTPEESLEKDRVIARFTEHVITQLDIAAARHAEEACEKARLAEEAREQKKKRQNCVRFIFGGFWSRWRSTAEEENPARSAGPPVEEAPSTPSFDDEKKQLSPPASTASTSSSAGTTRSLLGSSASTGDLDSWIVGMVAGMGKQPGSQAGQDTPITPPPSPLPRSALSHFPRDLPMRPPNVPTSAASSKQPFEGNLNAYRSLGPSPVEWI